MSDPDTRHWLTVAIGVAYSSTDSGWAPPQVIQGWPHHKPSVFNKYPSRVGYNREGQAIDWGTCSLSREKLIPEKEFKLFLDPSFCEGPEDGLTHENAVKHYINYMTKLNGYINDILMQRLPRWNEREVEYRFSTPTTWKSPWLTNQLKKWLAEAGFINTSKRRVVFSQTEAEAAAVYVTKYNQVCQAHDSAWNNANKESSNEAIFSWSPTQAELQQ